MPFFDSNRAFVPTRFPAISRTSALLAIVGALVSVFSTPALAEGPRLLVDLDTTPTGSWPTGFVELGGLTVFAATTSEYGRELWISDGTAEGTRLLFDANPGPADSTFDPKPFDPTTHDRDRLKVGERLFFAALTDGFGERLWSIDALGEATVLFDRFERILGEWQGRLLAVRRAEDGGLELWITDGTASGTHRHIGFDTDLTPNPGSRAVVVGDRAVFAADRHGMECNWWTLPLPAGELELLKKISDLECKETVTSLTPVELGGRLYFSFRTDETGDELWSTDGTAEGTQLFYDLNPGSQSSTPRHLTRAGDRLYLVANVPGEGESSRYVLWSTDGTVSGSRILIGDEGAAIYPILGSALEVNGQLWFSIATGSESLRQPWMSDGTVAGTRLLIADGPSTPVRHPIGQGVLERPGESDLGLFLGFSDSYEATLWTTDGTTAGTRRITGIAPVGYGNPESVPVFQGAAGRIWITGHDPGIGPEPWLVETPFPDSGELQARLLADVDTEGTASTSVGSLASTGDRAYFGVSGLPDDPGSRIWTTDGTAAGTRPVADTGLVPDGSRLDEGIYHEGAFYFFGEVPGHGQELVRLEGEGPFELLELVPGSESFPWPQMVETPSGLVAGDFIDSRYELWRVDGASDSPRRIAVLEPSLDPAQTLGHGTARLHAWGRGVAVWMEMSVASEDEYSSLSELWYVDGQGSDTRRLRSFDTMNVSNRWSDGVVIGDVFYFDLSGADGLNRLWKSDGTVSGTVPTSDILPAESILGIGSLLALRETLFFGAIVSGDECFSLWRSDGGAATRVHPGCARFTTSRGFAGLPGEPGQTPGPGVRDSLFFVATDDVTGSELWRVGPGQESARMVIDLEPGPASSNPLPFGLVGERLYFRAETSAYGTELYSTDGTTEGTRLEGDIRPGSVSSWPNDLVGVGGKVLFGADDGVHGRELWITDMACSPTSETLCLDSGRFQLASSWTSSAGQSASAAPERGRGHTLGLTEDTGGFWFFDPENVEAAVKVLDGRALNGHFWVYLASLSNVGFDLSVLDTETGRSKLYSNPDGTFASFGDVLALPAEGASAAPDSGRTTVSSLAMPLVVRERQGTPKLEPCAPSVHVLCLDGEPGDHRFRLWVSWKDFEGATGVARARELTADTGGFWFFDEANVEVLVKVLDARQLNGHFWVFLGSLSNVEFQLVVEDTQTGVKATYDNALGHFASFGDVRALPDSP